MTADGPKRGPGRPPGWSPLKGHRVSLVVSRERWEEIRQVAAGKGISASEEARRRLDHPPEYE